MSKISILGLSGSLRNARFRRGSLSLANEIEGIETEKNLTAYLVQQTKIRVDDFLEAGLSTGAPFDEVYRALHTRSGNRTAHGAELGRPKVARLIQGAERSNKSDHHQSHQRQKETFLGGKCSKLIAE